MNPIVFWSLALTSLVSGAFVVGKRSPMASALALAICLTALAGLFAALSAPFLFIIQILVYTGAVVVLIVFVIMLLDLREADLRAQSIQRGKLLFSALVCLLAGGLMLLRIAGARAAPPRAAVPAEFGTVENLADIVFTRYVLPFEIVSLILLVGILGAVVIAKRGE